MSTAKRFVWYLTPYLRKLRNRYICIAFRHTIAYNKNEGGGGMSKTTSIYARVEPEIKEQAESILNQLGIPMSNAINVFFKANNFTKWSTL